LYTLNDWEDVALDLNSVKEDTKNIMEFHFTDIDNLTSLQPGEVRVLHDIFVAIKDFNPEDREKTLDENGVKVLGYRAGELILMT
jgi:hypothetical protein